MSKPRASYMENIAAFHASCESAGIDTNDGIVLSLECDDQGKPLGAVLKQQGTPFILLGMIDKAKRMLEDTRKEIMNRLDEAERISKMVDKLPGELASKIKNLEMRMRAAAAEGDVEKMKSIQEELDNLLESSRDNIIDFLRKKRDENRGDDGGDDEGGEFNTGDFLKGGL
jgi:hypothetical protein